MKHRFNIAWSLPILISAAAWHSPWAAWSALLLFQLALVGLERLPALGKSPEAESASRRHAVVLWLHVPLQAAMLAVGVLVAVRHPDNLLAVVALGIGVGGVTGGQGITMAHELGHSRRKIDVALAWGLMVSVLYAHFMVEHYRGHHVLAATDEDPASARLGQTLWNFLPRTLFGSWRSAWRLEAARVRSLRQGWARSALLRAMLLQGILLLAVTWVGGAPALLFWLVQAAYAIFLLETTNYIEHYGLHRRRGEPFAVQHAWNADHLVTNCFIVNLQRHSDHHMKAWKPYPELQALPGPQLPTGYAGCLFLALLPPIWNRVMGPRAHAWRAAQY